MNSRDQRTVEPSSSFLSASAAIEGQTEVDMSALAVEG